MTKAYLAKYTGYSETNLAIVFAETANKAKRIAMGSFDDYVRYIDVRVNRLPEMDDREVELKENPNIEDLWYFNNGYGLFMDSSYPFDNGEYVILNQNITGDDICEFLHLDYGTELTLEQVETFMRKKFKVRK